MAYDQKSRKRAQRYLKKSTLSIAFRLNYNTEPELIEIYKRIPNKSQFFKNALLTWDEEHAEESEKSD